MNAPLAPAAESTSGRFVSRADQSEAARAMFMSSADYRESLRRYKPIVYVDGQLVECVADAPQLAPGVNAIGVSYDHALDPKLAPLMRASQIIRGQPGARVVNRMIAITESAGDLLNKLEAVRIL